MNKLGLLKQRGLCGVSCVSTRACNPAPKVPLSKIFWLTFKFVPVIQKFSRASQVITCVIQSPTAKPLQSSQACHLISLSLSDDSTEPEVFLANKLVMSIVQKPIDNVQADRSSQFCNSIVLIRQGSVKHIPSLHRLLINRKFPYHNFSGHMF